MQTHNARFHSHGSGAALLHGRRECRRRYAWRTRDQVRARARACARPQARRAQTPPEATGQNAEAEGAVTEGGEANDSATGAGSGPTMTVAQLQTIQKQIRRSEVMSHGVLFRDTSLPRVRGRAVGDSRRVDGRIDGRRSPSASHLQSDGHTSCATEGGAHYANCSANCEDSTGAGLGQGW